MPRILWVFLLVALVGCPAPVSPNPQSEAGSTFSGDYPIRVVVTVGMVGDLVREIGGRHVDVQQIMGPGVDPHLYKPTRDDVARIMEADLVFYCGLMLEGKMADTLVKIARQRPVFAVTEQVPAESLLEPAGAAGHPDPHLWMDVQSWSQCVDVVATALSDFDPSHSQDYRLSAGVYKQQLAALHAYGQTCLASVPADRRVLITSHDAFNYFGRAYNLEVEGVQGISTESEAGLQRVNELVDLIVSRQIPAVFVESSVPRKNIEAIVEGARARGHELTIGGELFSDAMGPTGTYEGTYLGMLDHNLTRVTRALGGQAPERGFQGKLSQ